jgi:1-deoxy-D-xylulose-5-phosphate synthase
MIPIKEISSPDFLKDLSKSELDQLSQDIRTFLIEHISKTGGHLSSNLGVVELTIALHKVFDSPNDRFIFDVGHQGYVHKILTGRAKDFDTLRQYKGLSGFLKRDESPHDIYEAGHSSTSIAAAAGIEFAKRYTKEEYRVIPLIGDGALTSGMAFEALNFLGGKDNQCPIIILNDNEMSISENIGYLANILNEIKSKRFVRNVRNKTYRLLPKFLAKLTSKVERGVKGFISSNTIFDDLGFSYYGPINGHDFKDLLKYLNMAKKSNKPCVVHVITEKGKGYVHSEKDALGIWHGVGPFDIASGESKKEKKKNQASWSTIVNDYMMDYAKKHQDFTVVVPAMIAGSGLIPFKEAFPEQIIDVGIAEQMAVTMSSGFAIEGVDVFTPIYSTFLQRAYDQVNHDVARQNLKVVFGIDRAGIVGADGETHQGVFDIPLLRHIPNMTVLHPSSVNELHECFNYAFYENKGPIAVRYERGNTIYKPETGITDQVYDLRWKVLNSGTKAVFIGFGSILNQVKEALSNEGVMVVNAISIKPLDSELLDRIALMNVPVIVYEESVLAGGFGSSILEYYSYSKQKVSVTLMGIKDQYVLQGDKESLLQELQLDKESVIKQVKSLL